MTASIAFIIVNLIAILGWLALIFFPAANLTKSIVRSGLLSILLSVFYIVSLFLMYDGWIPGGGYASLQSVAVLFTNEWALLAGWIHYLAFDLLIGTMALEKLEERNFITRAVSLFCIFTFGPLGWLISLVFSKIKHKKI